MSTAGESKKVCVVGSVYPRRHDDPEVPWMRRTLALLKERGWDVCVFAPSFEGLRSHEIDGIRVHRFRYFFRSSENLTHDGGAPTKVRSLRYKLISIPYILAGMVGLAALHRREKFDVLHVHWPFPHGLFALFARLFQPTKIVLNFHGASLLLGERFPFVNRVLDHCLARADAVVANSSFTVARIRAVRDVDVTIVPYGAAVRPDAIPHKPRTDAPLVFAVGRMIERKGFAHLIAAMPAVRARVPGARLVIASDGPLRGELTRQADDLGLSECVRFPGKVSDEELGRLFTEAAVFAMPSIVDSRGDTEGLGVVVIEAISYGCPVVATAVGGIPDLVKDGVTGRLVPQRDPAALAQAIIDVLTDSEFASRLAAGGLRHVNAEYDWKSVIDRLEGVYRRVGV
jgi:glycosyltransferase involved in cell wall biosynthesis